MLARTLVGRLAAVGAVLALSACPGKKPPVAPDTSNTQDVADELALVRVSPMSVAPDTAFAATLSGAGFSEGMSVNVGGTEATVVRFISDKQLEAEVPGLPEGIYDVTVTAADGKNVTLFEGIISEMSAIGCQDVVVHFDFDSSSLDDAAIGDLTDSLECLQKGASRVVIEGHTDTRGTTEYNLALGQRRADAVRSFLAKAGVDAERMDTISYGKERLSADGESDDDHQENRRSEVKPSK